MLVRPQYRNGKGLVPGEGLGAGKILYVAFRGAYDCEAGFDGGDEREAVGCPTAVMGGLQDIRSQVESGQDEPLLDVFPYIGGQHE